MPGSAGTRCTAPNAFCTAVTTTLAHTPAFSLAPQCLSHPIHASSPPAIPTPRTATSLTVPRCWPAPRHPSATRRLRRRPPRPSRQRAGVAGRYARTAARRRAPATAATRARALAPWHPAPRPPPCAPSARRSPTTGATTSLSDASTRRTSAGRPHPARRRRPYRPCRPPPPRARWSAPCARRRRTRAVAPRAPCATAGPLRARRARRAGSCARRRADA
mmetsp:Transcript_60781/g.166548  ORF Transcript_60781/g.166548 Transcript_60781/m.166548 type:complete len:219 (+) Transcript_60781:176-832(+)